MDKTCSLQQIPNDARHSHAVAFLYPLDIHTVPPCPLLLILFATHYCKLKILKKSPIDL